MKKTTFWIFLLVFAMLALICKDIFLTRGLEDIERTQKAIQTELQVAQEEINELEDTIAIELR